MHKINLKKFAEILKIRLHNFREFTKNLPLKKYVPHIGLSWGTVLYGVPIFFLLYYPLGAYFSQHIAADTKIKLEKNTAEESALLNTAAYIINQETNVHMWTPNMPIIFPGYVLDNMPEFQTGEIKATAKMIKAFAKVMKPHLPEGYEYLDEAAKYLAYSPTVWFFSQKAGKIFAPSSSTQYNKAKKALININNAAAERNVIFAYNSEDLQKIIDCVYEDLQKTSHNLEEHIRINSYKFVDFQADNLFYNTKGKLYAYHILFSALGEDYKSVIANPQTYSQWLAVLKIFENAIKIEPRIVKNSDLNSSFSPNHLAYLNMYVLNAAEHIKKLNFLEQEELLR